MSSPLQLSRKAQMLAASAAGLVVLLAGGGLLAIRLVEGSSPPPLTSPRLVGAASPSSGPRPGPSPGPSPGPDATPSPEPAGQAPAGSPSPTAAAIDGTWRVAAGSVAGYRVQETLFGQGNIAVGRTSSISGSLVVGGGSLQAATLSVNLASIRSDRSARDQQFQSRIMDVASYPTARFTLSQPVALGTLGAAGRVATTVSGSLTLRGVTRHVAFPVTISHTGPVVNVRGSVQITFADYSIPNPSNSIAQTGSQGVLEFSLNFAQ